MIYAQCNGSCESCEPFATDFNMMKQVAVNSAPGTFSTIVSMKATVWYRVMFYIQKTMKCLFSTTNATNTPLKCILQGHHFFFLSFFFNSIIVHEHTPVLNGSPDCSALAVFSIVCTTGTRTLGLAWVPISEWRKQLRST